jgi:ubiquinone/menaquinone biosynthesis C-methylase UbiE
MTVQQQGCSWSDVAPGWDRWRDRIEEGDGVITDALFAAAGPLPSARVLELGAGTGEMAARLAAEVGADGSVLASDEADGMVKLLTTRLSGLSNVTVDRLDLTAIALDDDAVDAALCRMGLMLVADPARATSEVRRVVRPGGRFAVAVWAEPAANPWLAVTGMAAVMQGVLPGPPPAGPGGPFSLADPAMLRSLLEQAGFTDVSIEAVEGSRRYAGPEEVVDMSSSLAPPLHAALAAADPGKITAMTETVRQLTTAYVVEDGLDVPLKAWVASGTA